MRTLNKKKDQYTIRLDLENVYTKNDKIKYTEISSIYIIQCLN